MLACVFMVGWVRSFAFIEGVAVPIGATEGGSFGESAATATTDVDG